MNLYECSAIEGRRYRVTEFITASTQKEASEIFHKRLKSNRTVGESEFLDESLLSDIECELLEKLEKE